jgi:drug/metabolite transporter (DMT)-like permease
VLQLGGIALEWRDCRRSNKGGVITKADLSVAFGIGAAVGYGSADYLAKTLTDKLGFLPTLFYLEFFGSPVLGAITFVIVGVPVPPLGPLALLVGLSLVNLLGSFNLYRAFEFGRLSIVSPIASGYPALIVVMAISFLGERLSLVEAAGIGITLTSLTILSRPSSRPSQTPNDERRGLHSAIMAFLAYAIFFFGLHFVVGPITPLAASAISRAVAFVGIAPFALWRGVRLLPPVAHRRRVASTVILDSIGIVSYTYGLVAGGSLSILATVSGLFSAVTVLWSVTVLHDRPSLIEWAAIGGIFTGVALLSYF